MKRLGYLAICVVVLCGLSSCILGGNMKQDNCNHVWQTEITGGQINVASDSSQTVGQACTVIKTCTLCGATEGSTVNPTKGLKYVSSAEAVTVSCGSCTERNIIIPAKVKFADAAPVDVTTIGSFSNKKITSVIIVSGIKEISSSAFGECSLLTTVTIADSVTKIGTLAFNNCYNLSEIRMPSDFEFELDLYGNYNMFTNCYALKSVTPSSLVCNKNYYCFESSFILKDKYNLSAE